MKQYLPWHKSQWGVLQRGRQQGKLPHAFLLSGVRGVGKRHFAEHFAKSLLCQSPDTEGQACGACRYCKLCNAQTHPDFLWIEPKELGQAIKVDQIRQLITSTQTTAQMGGYRVVIIDPADALNINAANALLKTLEAPAGRTLLLLLSSKMVALPATIRSRCQIMYFPAPQQSIGMAWLQSAGVPAEQAELLLRLAYDAPLYAQALHAQNEMDLRATLFEEWRCFSQTGIGLISMMAAWSKYDLNRVLAHWESWVQDMISLQQICRKRYLVNQDLAGALMHITKRCRLQDLYRFLDEIYATRKMLYGQPHVNATLLLEHLGVAWLSVVQHVG